MGHPIAESLINGSTQCFIARIDRNNFGSKLQHPINIGRLSFYIHASHVDHTGNTNTSTSSGCGNTVLTGSGFSNHSLCTETLCQQCLAQSVIDFMGTRMGQVFALNVNIGFPSFTQFASECETSGSACPLLQFPSQLISKRVVVQKLLDAFLKFFQSRHQCLWSKLPSKRSKAAVLVWELSIQ